MKRAIATGLVDISKSYFFRLTTKKSAFAKHFLHSTISSFIFFFISGVIFCQYKLLNKPVAYSAKVSPELEKKVRNTLKQNSRKLQLVENNGQYGLPADVVAYFSSGHELIFIEKNRLRILVATKNGEEDQQDFTAGQVNYSRSADAKKYSYNAFDILFKGSPGFSEFEKKEKFQFKRNFINTSTPDSKPISADSYGEITLKNIYAGIDLRLYSHENGHLEFDWIIWPGSDPATIRMEFSGQKKISKNREGQLQIKLSMGIFNMRMPESYYVTPEGKKNANVQFLLRGENIVRFKVIGSRQKKYPLVIDPDLLWGTFFDGGNLNFDEYLYAIDFNNSNNLLYCAGAASMQVSTAYAAALSGSYDSTFAAIPDALIYALTKNGHTVQYITYLGGSGADVSIGLSLSNSFVYTCGSTSSSNFPVTKISNGNWPAFDSVYHGNTDGFVCVFNLQLDSLVYCSYLGGSGSDLSLTIRAVSDSAFYVSLQTEAALSTSNPNYLAAFADNTFGGASEAWIGKFTSFNSLRFGTYIGGTNDDLVNDFQVLTDGDVVFIGNTQQITQVNPTVADNGTGQEVLFGRINVPVSGSVSFDIVDKIGGSNNDMGWGILNLGDSVSVLVGQTNSSNFPLGTVPGFQSTRRGNYDGFLAKIKNDGSGGYKATFLGGNDVDILVSVRPVIINNEVLLLGFGTTQSDNLITLNINGGTLFSGNNTGGQDMMFIICDLNLTTKYYLSYIGGTANDYLGKTGAPIGANHLYFNSADSVLYLGTTTHSYDSTQAPQYVGRGIADVVNMTVPVFDETKGNGTNDTHTIIAISTHRLFTVLPLTWISFVTTVLRNCNIYLSWKTTHEQNLLKYSIERSTDGKFFVPIGSRLAGQESYFFVDNNSSGLNEKLFYRIRAEEINGKSSLSTVNVINPCSSEGEGIKIYPAITSSFFKISGLSSVQVKNTLIEVFDASGKKVKTTLPNTDAGVQTLYFEKNPASGPYFVTVRNTKDGKVIKTQIVIIRN